MIPNIVIYSNCQSKGIRYFLNMVIEGNYEEILNYEYIREKRDLPLDVIKKADIFIYQPIDRKHGIYSTDLSVENNILSHLSPNCKKVTFPYIYNSAFWSFVPHGYGNDIVGNTTHNKNYINTEPIEKLKKEGKSIETVTQMFLDGDIDFEYQRRFDECIKILKEKEDVCDVKVSDFILKHTKDIRLFLTPNHPTTQVYIHCVNQIIQKLDINKYLEQGNFDPNLAKLEGDYKYSTCDLKFWNFKYPVTWDNHGWIKPLVEIYNLV